MESVKTYLRNSGYFGNGSSMISKLPIDPLSPTMQRYALAFSAKAATTVHFRLLAALAAVVGIYLHQTEASLWTALSLSGAYISYAVVSWMIISLLPSALPSPLPLYITLLVDAAVVLAVVLLVAGPLGVLTSAFIFYLVYLYLSSAYKLVLESSVGTDAKNSERLPRSPALLDEEVQTLSARKWKESHDTRALLDVSRELSSTLDLDTILSSIANSAPLVTGLSKCVVMLRDNAGYLVGRAANVGPEELNIKTLDELVERPSQRSLARKVWSARRPVEINNDNNKGINREESALGARGSILAIPLLNGDEPLGIVYAFDGAKRSFTEGEKNTAHVFGELSAQAIKNASTIQEAHARVGILTGELASTVTQLEQIQESKRRNVMSVNGLSLDASNQRVTVMEQPVELSPTEFRLLYALAERAGKPVGQDILFEKAWGEESGGQTNVVDVYIHRLRKKIEDDASSPKRILTVRGEGYKLC
ncbi:MAG: GAF domain-containing protein [Dehalococcoidia bacterium]|nr:GAF domain-containing protein [Dehalococcoidia bacterium]